jgi:hypothetical protein
VIARETDLEAGTVSSGNVETEPGFWAKPCISRANAMANPGTGNVDDCKPDTQAMPYVLPLPIRLLNRVGARLEHFGAFRNLLAVDSIIKQAKKDTGLSDWGAEDFLTPLELLTQPDTDKVRITFFGKYSLRRELVRCLTNRLLIRDEIKRHPETLSETISRPLFIVGLPRIGSTLLQRLLSQDSHCRPLLHWETLQPAPAPDPRTHESDPRIENAEREMKSVARLFPEPVYAAMHFADVTQPEECWFLLQNTLMLPGPFFVMANFPEYFAWQQEQDLTNTYAFYKLQLQILQRKFPPAHWVLKSSDHLSNLGVLLSTFPDASVVHLHRDPQEVVPSSANIMIKSLEMTNTLDRDVVAELPQQIMDGFLHDIERAMAARRQADPRRFMDVHYRELIKDPVDVIRQIYEYFGYSFDGQFEARIVKWLDENPKEKHGAHRYSLEHFGLTPERVHSHFSDYCEEFGIVSG